MPCKNPLTTKQKQEILVKEYKLKFSSIDEECRKVLELIEKNKYGAKKFHNPLVEAAETFSQWKQEGLV